MAPASIPLAEVGTTLVSGCSHHKLGNVDWRTVGILAVPGGAGTFLGAHFMVSLPADVAKPWVGGILFCLGLYVIWRFLALGGRRPSFKGRLSAGVCPRAGSRPGWWSARCRRRSSSSRRAPPWAPSWRWAVRGCWRADPGDEQQDRSRDAMDEELTALSA